jgi:hypothetical protein
MPTYRTNGAWGSGIGVNLTPAQVDNNFYELRTDLDDVIANPPTADGLASVTQSGFYLTFHTTLGNELGPIAIPVVYTVWRGDWAPFTLYSAADQFRVDGVGIFAVLQGHTSAATFDPDESGGSPPAPFYLQLIAVSTMLGMLDDLIDVSITAEAYGQILGYNGAAWVNREFAEPVATQNGTGSPGLYELVITDRNSYIRGDHAAGLTVVIRPEADVDFPIGTTVTFEQAGIGSVLIAPDDGVTLNCVATHTPETNGQFSVAQVKKVASDEWVIFGNLVPA